MKDEKTLLKKLIELYAKQENIKVKYEIKKRGLKKWRDID